MRPLRLALFLLAASLTVSSIWAKETLILSNGTSLVGTILKEEDGKITFNADLIGEVVVESASVVKRVVDEPKSVAATAATAAGAAAEPAAAPVVSSAPPAPAASSTVPADPSEASAAQGKAFWKRILSINGSYTSAAYNQGAIKGAPAGFPTGAEAGLQGKQSTMQVSGTLIGATPYQAVTLQGSYGYADYQPVGAVLNNLSLSGTYTYVLSPKDYVLTKGTYNVDKPAGIEHDFEQVFGFGHKFIDTATTKLDVIPGVSLVDDRRGTIWDDQWILSGGFLEHLDYAFNDRVSLEQRFKYRVGVEHTSIWAIDSYLGIKAAISEHVSLTTGATYTFDNTLGPVPPALAAAFIAQGVAAAQIRELEPAEKAQLLITSGLEYSW